MDKCNTLAYECNFAAFRMTPFIPVQCIDVWHVAKTNPKDEIKSWKKSICVLNNNNTRFFFLRNNTHALSSSFHHLAATASASQSLPAVAADPFRSSSGGTCLFQIHTLPFRFTHLLTLLDSHIQRRHMPFRFTRPLPLTTCNCRCSLHHCHLFVPMSTSSSWISPSPPQSQISPSWPSSQRRRFRVIEK